MEKNKLIKIISKCHILLHPSPFHDPYPNAVLEGLSAGCVVMVSSACGVAHDRVLHKKTGLIHKAGDSRQLANQIIWLLKKRERLKKIAYKGKKMSNNWPLSRSLMIIYKILGIK